MNETCANCGNACKGKKDKRVNQVNFYCDRRCYYEYRDKKKKRYSCKECGQAFASRSANPKYCSTACSNKGRTGIKYDGSREYDNTISLRKTRQTLIDLKGEICEMCGLGSIWNNEPLTLQIDHKDGNRKRNTLDNLRFLCPNCHSQTPTWGRRKIVAT